MTDILDETDEFVDRREGKRPVFITVLCILTWVGCGLGLISGLFQLWSYSIASSAINAFQQANGTGRTGVNFIFWTSIATLVGSLLCAIAAMFMFKQKKIGFFIYIVGQAIPIIAGFYSALAVTNGIGIGQSFTIVMTAAGMIFPIAFIIMYGVNLKYMNK